MPVTMCRKKTPRLLMARTKALPAARRDYFIRAPILVSAQLFPQLSPAARAAVTTAGGAGTSGLFWRPIGAGGNPLTGEGKQDERLFYTYRGSVELDGQLTEDTDGTWH